MPECTAGRAGGWVRECTDSERAGGWVLGCRQWEGKWMGSRMY